MEPSARRLAILIERASQHLFEQQNVDGDIRTVCEKYFPDPAEQADALLEFCEGEIDEARRIAAINHKFARHEADRIYWARVEALISTQERDAVIERLVANKLKRRTVQKRS